MTVILRKYWKHALITFLLLVSCGVGYYVWAMYSSLDGLKKPPEQSRFQPVLHKLPNPKRIEPPKWVGEERVNILLLGGDSRGLKVKEVPRSDSIMIASFDPKAKRANLFSILRDTYVDIPGVGRDRMNAALALGGPELAMKTVGNWTGLDMQYYVYTDFKGFIALIDALGGVEFEVEKDMIYTDSADKNQFNIHLKKGKQVLNGETALMYARFRYDAMSDFARTKRQRDLMLAVANKMKSAWSIIQLPSLINKVSPHVETNLSADDIIKLASLGYDSSVGQSHQLPPMGLVTDIKVNHSAMLGVTDMKKFKAYIQQALQPPSAQSSSMQQGVGQRDEKQQNTQLPSNQQNAQQSSKQQQGGQQPSNHLQDVQQQNRSGTDINASKSDSSKVLKHNDLWSH
ncbi:LCP family protein [Paenibacillus sp. 481]|uniref:LCP family protein n=1 Tax=Paenibacillus sp. 481 TaxID=2835869 RepID=UPI001E5D7619|nr:LCP family protein [Paenibacillus sp. 481]